MAVTIERTGNPMFPWRVSTECLTKQEAFAKAIRIEEIAPEAFIPSEHHAAFAPMPAFDELPPMPIPEIPEALARDADDDVGLKAGEALQPVNQVDEE